MDLRNARVITLLLFAIFVTTFSNFVYLFFLNSNLPIFKEHSNRTFDFPRAMKLSSPEQTIRIAIVTDGFESNQNFAILVKSILFNTQKRSLNQVSSNIHFHIFTVWSEHILSTLMTTWDLQHVTWEIHNLTPHLSEIDWIPNSHYAGFLALSKLMVPQILADLGLSEVIVLDTDMVVQFDIDELWKKRLNMRENSSVIFGMTENQGTPYLRQKSLPALGRGFNSGLALVLLDRVNRVDWVETWNLMANRILEYKTSLLHGDQDIYNGVFRDNPSIVFRLPCYYNCQFPTVPDFRFQFCPACQSDAKILHFNYISKNSYFLSPDTLAHIGRFAEVLQFYSGLDGYQFRSSNHGPETSAAINFNSNFNETVSRDLTEQCACFFDNGNFKVHLLFLPFSDWRSVGPIKTPETHKNSYAQDVALVTQFSFDRLRAFESLANSWFGVITAALYISESEVIDFIHFWMESSVLSQRSNIALHIVYKIPGRPYPINFLRNVALKNSPSDLVFISDVDFVASENLYQSILDHKHMLYDVTSKKLLVVPAFELSHIQIEDFQPRNKENLMRLKKFGRLKSFLFSKWPQGHGPTNFSKWVSVNSTYQAHFEHMYEPFVVGRKDQLCFFDERFSGYGWNKSTWVYRLWKSLSFQFWVLPSSFIVHVSHANSVWKQDFLDYPRSSSMLRKCMDSIRKVIVSQINSESHHLRE